MTFRLLLLALCLALGGGCVSRHAGPAIVDSYAEPYRLDSGDQLRVTVFDQADLTNSYTVDQAGYVTIPLIGMVPARGETPLSLAAAVAAKLRQGYLRDPDVSIEVEQYRPFFIQGEVRSPGQYAYVSGLTVETAVAVAGGYTPRAAQRDAMVTRIVNGEQVTGLLPTTDPIRPGDSIVVRQRLF